MLQFVMEYWIQFAFGILICFSLYLFRKVKTYFVILEQAKEKIRVLYHEYSKLGMEEIMIKFQNISIRHCQEGE